MQETSWENSPQLIGLVRRLPEALPQYADLLFRIAAQCGLA
jgi:hypothetical protein